MVKNRRKVSKNSNKQKIPPQRDIYLLYKLLLARVGYLLACIKCKGY